MDSIQKDLIVYPLLYILEQQERLVPRKLLPGLFIYGNIGAIDFIKEDVYMEKVDRDLAQRDKTELIAIIKQMLRQQPELQWLLTTPLPTQSKRKATIDPKVYRHQILAALSPEDNKRNRKHRDEIKNKLTAITAIADEFAGQEDYFAAVAIYEVLVEEVLEHYFDHRDEYVTFSVILYGCIDGLDTCFAGEEDNQEMRTRVIRALFAIYRFYVDSGMDLDEDIPGLLVGNTTREERQIIAGWVRDALSKTKEMKWGAEYSQQRYSKFLLDLEKER